MKNVKLKSSILGGICTLLTLFSNVGAWQNGNIKEITRPYLGVYECQSAQLGERDLLTEFSYLHLELKSNNVFLLHYCEKKGEPNILRGEYSYDYEKKVLTMQLADNKNLKRDFPLENGELIVSLPMGNKQLRLIFVQK